jgi:hypothetical protein
MKTKFAIGCLIQWYEADIVNEYFESLNTAINEYGPENIIIDILISANTELEKAESADVIKMCVNKIQQLAGNIITKTTNNLITIADYRREFNLTYCDTADVLIWGESDMLCPKHMFVILNQLHQQVKNNTPKYLTTFSICKMWDDTWKPMEHPSFTENQHSDSKLDWWSLNYDMSIDEMNSFNDQIEHIDITTIHPHKFNGCGLVISAEVIRSGVNIPKSIFFIHEDSAFMHITNKLLGNIPQYHIKNILLVHNRKHAKKRNYIAGETGTTVGQKRNSNTWYTIANQMCEQNYHNLFNPNYKSYTWKDVFDKIRNNE